MDFGKGMFLGLAAGIGICLAIKPVTGRDIRRLKRKTRRMMKFVGNTADGICCKMK